MAKIEFKGVDAYRKKLEALGKRDADKAIRYAIYPAANLAAEELKKNVPVSMDPRSRGDLQDGIILTKMEDDGTGFISTTLTFEGYDRKGAPLRLVARALESGRSTRKGKVGKHPFMRKTIAHIKKQAESMMQTALDKYFYDYMRK